MEVWKCCTEVFGRITGVPRVFDLCVILYKFHMRRWASVVPYCLKKGLKAEIQKKWPLGMDVSWQRCISLCCSWQAVGGCACLWCVCTLSLAGHRRNWSGTFSRAWRAEEMRVTSDESLNDSLKSQRNCAKFPSANGACATTYLCRLLFLVGSKT